MKTNAATDAIIDYLAHLTDCRPLQTSAEREAATALIETLGFPTHHDPQKNWDTFKCMAYVRSLNDLHGPVLDAGTGPRAMVLNWLKRIGYDALYGCDLAKGRPEFFEKLGVIFSRQDLTATDYKSNFFQAVTCISVLEHNIPLEAFGKEMARILRPGGLLLISTDYWSETIDCSGIYPYGEEAGEMKIFDPASLKAFVKIAEGAGFEPCRPIEYDTREKAVRWDRVDRDYTFAFMAFRKRG